MDELKNTLDTIKTIDWDSASVSFFVVKRKLIQRSAKYDMLPHLDMINLSVNFDFVLLHKKSSLYNQQMEFI